MDTQLASGMHNAKVPHDDRCRDGIGELMAEDDDQRHQQVPTVRVGGSSSSGTRAESGFKSK